MAECCAHRSPSEQPVITVRSLDKSIEADCLATVVKNRAAPPWQNVLLFAAGRCLTDRQWLPSERYLLKAQLRVIRAA